MSSVFGAPACLVAALLLFLLSTRQGALWIRVAVLVVAVAALSRAGWIIAESGGHYGLWGMIDDAWRHRANFQNSAMATALQRNEASIDRHTLPLLDIFLIGTALTGLVAVLALTRGETVERFIRPVMFGLLGMMAGAAFALSVVAVGFGGPIKQRSYVALLSPADVHDGDTLRMGDVSIRLFGLDTPELGQTCYAAGQSVDCGDAARRALAQAVAGHIVQCLPRQLTQHGPVESFGRPVLQCWIVDAARRVDLTAEMIAAGHGVQYRGEDWGYSSAARTAQANWCMLRPDYWRARDRASREAFLDRKFGDVPAGALVGCTAMRNAPIHDQLR